MNINGYCPHCGVDLDGESVYKTFLILGAPPLKALERASFYEGWREHGINNKWGRQISIFSREKDRAVEYICPDCNGKFNEVLK